MSVASILIPDFVLILLGLIMRRSFGFSEDFWLHMERMTYYILFPALLFNALAHNRIEFRAAAALIETGILYTAAAMLLAYAGKFLFSLPPMSFASAFQCAYRFNSYIGFAIVGGLHQSDGIAAFALLIGFMVPLANTASVWMLARHSGGSVWGEIVRNPLILSTLAGIAFSLSGLELPGALDHTLTLLGSAALPMGLIAVGAGLTLRAMTQTKAAVAYFTAVKLLAAPAAAILIARLLGLQGTYFDTALVHAALPTASSAYILAVRMGGDGKLVAAIMAVNVLAAIVTLPLWLGFARG